MGYKFYKITFFNECTEANENVIIPVKAENAQKMDDYDFSSMLDTFLWSQCYCDAYEYRRAKELTEKQSKKFDDILYSCVELEDAPQNSDILTSSALYHANCIYYSVCK